MNNRKSPTPNSSAAADSVGFAALAAEPQAIRRMKRVYEIDGQRFSTLEEFYEEISRVLIPGAGWGRNLDAFNGILRGVRLGYPETVRQIECRFTVCHPLSRRKVSDDLALARNQVGPTVFDWLVEIIGIHCQGGREVESGVELVLA